MSLKSHQFNAHLIIPTWLLLSWHARDSEHFSNLERAVAQSITDGLHATKQSISDLVQLPNPIQTAISLR